MKMILIYFTINFIVKFKRLSSGENGLSNQTNTNFVEHVTGCLRRSRM